MLKTTERLESLGCVGDHGEVRDFVFIWSKEVKVISGDRSLTPLNLCSSNVLYVDPKSSVSEVVGHGRFERSGHRNHCNRILIRVLRTTTTPTGLYL